MQKLISTFILRRGRDLRCFCRRSRCVQQLARPVTLQSLAENDISVEQAMLVAQGAIDACKKDNSVISVAVVDRYRRGPFLVARRRGFAGGYR